MDASWSLAQAKARLSEVLENARETGPQTITRYGRPAAVVVSVEEWARRTRQGNLAEFLAASPLPGSGLRVKRVRESPRPPRL